VAELILKSHRFRREREADWRRLENLLKRLEAGSIRSLKDEEIIALPVLYRSALSSLSVARATSLDQALIDYLESLCTRAYFYVYGTRSTLVERVGRFFAADWPNAVRAVWRETLVCAAMLLLGGVAAYLMTLQDPDWFYSLMPQAMAQGRDPTASAAALREVIYPTKHQEMLSAFAAFLFTHNATVALSAFALGFAFCVAPLALMVMQGAEVGALLALYAKHGLGIQLLGWLAIHGVTELWAIVIAAGAGVRIGWTLAFPGERTRLEALSETGRTAATAMTGAMIMLVVAGLLEGFARQLVQADAIRFGVAGLTALVWALYLYAPRKAPISNREARRGAG
jgi:uncharacterized membrane protein SpoIIM required for sporulation